MSSTSIVHSQYDAWEQVIMRQMICSGGISDDPDEFAEIEPQQSRVLLPCSPNLGNAETGYKLSLRKK